MSVTGIWTDITSSFDDFLENTLTGTTTTFRVSPVINVKSTAYADSIFNGAYSIFFEGAEETKANIQSKLFPVYNIRVDIAFSVKNRTVYYQVLEDVEQIIRQRVEPATWSDYSTLIHIRHTDTTIPEFIDGDQENRLVVSIRFKVRGIINR